MASCVSKLYFHFMFVHRSPTHLQPFLILYIGFAFFQVYKLFYTIPRECWFKSFMMQMYIVHHPSNSKASVIFLATRQQLYIVNSLRQTALESGGKSNIHKLQWGENYSLISV